MKRLLFTVAILAAVAFPASAQRLVVGDRAPDISAGRWLAGTPSLDGKAVMVEFFHSTNKYSVARLEQLDRLARSSRGTLSVVVVTRENDSAVTSMLSKGSPAYYPILDRDGRTFSAYGVKFVPYAVIYDRRGRILWIGNPTSLGNDDIIKLIR